MRQPRQNLPHIARVFARDDNAVVLFIARNQFAIAVQDQAARRRDQADVDAVFFGQKPKFIGLIDLHVAHPRAQHGHE